MRSVVVLLLLAMLVARAQPQIRRSGSTEDDDPQNPARRASKIGRTKVSREASQIGLRSAGKLSASKVSARPTRSARPETREEMLARRQAESQSQAGADLR